MKLFFTYSEIDARSLILLGSVNDGADAPLPGVLPFGLVYPVDIHEPGGGWEGFEVFISGLAPLQGFGKVIGHIGCAPTA